MYLLAFESSCDETSVAVLDNNMVLSNIVSTQLFHAKYGGVIPELAARSHLSMIDELTKEALIKADISIGDIDLFAVTTEPGLVGALLVGSNYAKGLALKYNKPIIPINHIQGHLYSGHLQDESLGFPCISLVVSGGHTTIFKVDGFNEYSILGSTIDDAAGEAFDKVAKMLGLPYPGGAEVDKLAKLGNADKFDFPKSFYHLDNYNFSFSGLKTSVRYFLQKNYPDKSYDNDINDICASVQKSIVDVLVHKTIKACKNYNIKSISISGGVSANSKLREEFQSKADQNNFKLVIPDITYCIDNAAMIGFIANEKFKENYKEIGNSTNNSTKIQSDRFKFTVSSNSIRAINS